MPRIGCCDENAIRLDKDVVTTSATTPVSDLILKRGVQS